MTAILANNSYGKSAVRLVKVVRNGEHHEIRELTVDIALEGDFESAHSGGDNSRVLPTDTMKNTVYAKAREQSIGAPDDFARLLGEHFLRASDAADRARVTITEHGWRRLTVGGKEHGHAFERAGSEMRVARAHVTRTEVEHVAGIRELLVLKSAHSAFSGYPRDKYTTLRETEDRILATSISTEWRYRGSVNDFDAQFARVRRALLETFADHDSKSVQHTLHAMGEAVIDRCDAVDEITITMPNKHHLLVDLAPFELDNANEIFVPTSEPYGLIEATLRRGV